MKRFLRVLIDHKTPPATAALYEQTGSQIKQVWSCSGTVHDVMGLAMQKYLEEGIFYDSGRSGTGD